MIYPQKNHIYRIANVENGRTLTFNCVYPLRDINVWTVGLICQVAHESLNLTQEQVADCTGNNDSFSCEYNEERNILFVYLDTEILFFIVEKKS